MKVAGTGAAVAEHLRRAEGLCSRFRGLLGAPELNAGEGLLLAPAAQVHTFGMRYSIDVLFIDGSGRVLHRVLAMRPNRMSRLVRGSRYVLELPCGTVEGVARVGDQLSFRDLYARS